MRLWLLPEGASTFAGDVDSLFFFLLAVSFFFSVLIAAAIVIFAVRFRRSTQRQVSPTFEGMMSLELTWTVIPFLIAMMMFFWGARLFVKLQTPPDNALQVYVVGKQWMWKAQHLEGRREINEVHVPLGRPVRLIMTSEDVIHSFYVPAFRVKQDAVPGRYSYLWFEPTKAGTYHLFCAEYCGTQHSHMIGRVIVMDPAEFQDWLSGSTGASANAESMADAGKQLFDQLGCASCHQANSGARGPNLAGLFNRQVSLVDGRTVLADEAYIRNAILNPQAEVVSGYQPIMPTFKGLVSEEGLLQLIAYIKSIEATQKPAEPPGKAHAEAGEAGQGDLVRTADAREPRAQGAPDVAPEQR